MVVACVLLQLWDLGLGASVVPDPYVLEETQSALHSLLAPSVSLGDWKIRSLWLNVEMIMENMLTLCKGLFGALKCHLWDSTGLGERSKGLRDKKSWRVAVGLELLQDLGVCFPFSLHYIFTRGERVVITSSRRDSSKFFCGWMSYFKES